MRTLVIRSEQLGQLWSPGSPPLLHTTLVLIEIPEDRLRGGGHHGRLIFSHMRDMLDCPGLGQRGGDRKMAYR